MKITLLLAAALLSIAMTVSARSDEKLKEGDEAPDFELVGSDGNTYKLSDLVKERAVVIAWFPKAFTGGWTKECKSLRDNGKALKEFDVAYFAASVDPPEKNKEFAESLEADYPILSDPDGKVAKAYGIYNAERMIASRTTFYVGKDRKILFVDDKVKVDEHGEDIAKKLKELEIPKKEK